MESRNLVGIFTESRTLWTDPLWHGVYFTCCAVDMMAVYMYQLVTPEQYKEALDLFNDFFLPLNPVQRAVGCTTQTDSSDQEILKCLKQGLSWCVIDERTGKIVGVRITGSEKITELPDTMPTFDKYLQHGWSKEWSAIWVLLNSAMDVKKTLTTYQESKMLELFALCVHPDHQKLGIATELVKRTLDHGVKCGFSFAGVICTSAYAQRLFEKLEFEKVKELCYATYVDSGTKSLLFKDVEEPHKAVISYVKKLSLIA